MEEGCSSASSNDAPSGQKRGGTGTGTSAVTDERDAEMARPRSRTCRARNIGSLYCYTDLASRGVRRFMVRRNAEMEVTIGETDPKQWIDVIVHIWVSPLLSLYDSFLSPFSSSSSMLLLPSTVKYRLLPAASSVLARPVLALDSIATSCPRSPSRPPSMLPTHFVPS